MQHSFQRDVTPEDITPEQAYSLCLLSVVIAFIGLGTMVPILL